MFDECFAKEIGFHIGYQRPKDGAFQRISPSAIGAVYLEMPTGKFYFHDQIKDWTLVEGPFIDP